MIIHSHEYFVAMIKEMEGFLSHVEKQIYGKDAVFLKDGINQEINFCKIALDNMNCIHCMHKCGEFNTDGTPKHGAVCRINGQYPEGMKCGEFYCINWIWDDVPF